MWGAYVDRWGMIREHCAADLSTIVAWAGYFRLGFLTWHVHLVGTLSCFNCEADRGWRCDRGRGSGDKRLQRSATTETTARRERSRSAVLERNL